tara:strand:- start:940 stop:1242 length:303 start_codon:yes stop_codon:yes gene_type:complete
MSKILALRFLILQSLNKNKSKLRDELFVEIAKSLKVEKENEQISIKWFTNGVEKQIPVEKKNFDFYQKSEFKDESNVNLIDQNELSAKNIVNEVIKKSLS